MSSLADRVRGIVAPPSKRADPPAPPLGARAAFGLDPTQSDLSTLGGEWRDGCFIVERRWPASSRHGKEAVGTYAQCLDEASAQAVLFAGDPPARAPFVFIDLETTGLNGGAGTQAFLVGCGWFERDGAFSTRQFLVTRHADERPLLEVVSSAFEGAGALVTFNGKSFDAPLLETRYLFHRLSWPIDCLPHVDVLHPARQFWGRRVVSCSLGLLEREILGVRRSGDVAGFEVPARYFHFVRTGDAGPLAAVLDHNRRDLLSLAALTARLFHIARAGVESVRDAGEAVALGRVYARAGLDDRAQDAFAHAIDCCRSPRGAFDAIRIDALRLLALARRRARRFDEAAACWRELLAIRGCPVPVVREASEALAIHHEHRLRDLPAAKSFALQTLDSLEDGAPSRWSAAVHHRLSRLERKANFRSLKFEV